MSTDERSFDWNELVKKEARGVNGLELGEVKAIGNLNIMVQKGMLIKETYYLPKYLMREKNDQIVWFNVTEEQLKSFENEQPPTTEDFTKYQTEDMPEGAEAVIPVLEERVQVSKKSVTEEVIIVRADYRIQADQRACHARRDKDYPKAHRGPY